MLISKSVKIKATGFLVKKFKCKRNQIIEVEIKDLTNGSNSIVDVECDYCGIICHVVYREYFKQTKIINKYCCKAKKCKSQKLKDCCLKTHGVENTYQLESTKNKIGKIFCFFKIDLANTTFSLIYFILEIIPFLFVF